MSNAGLIAEIRAFMKPYATPTRPLSWKVVKLNELATALEKSEAEVVRLGGVIARVHQDAQHAQLLYAADDEYNSGVRDQAEDTLGILASATVSAEEGAK